MPIFKKWRKKKRWDVKDSSSTDTDLVYEKGGKHYHTKKSKSYWFYMLIRVIINYY